MSRKTRRNETTIGCESEESRKKKPARKNVETSQGCAYIAVDVVAITKATKLLLTSSVPDIKADGAVVCVEDKRVDIHAERCCGYGWRRESRK